MPDLHFKNLKNDNTPLLFTAPGSKSVTNRILISSALNPNKNKLTNILLAEDTLIMINALSDLGINFKFDSKLNILEKTGETDCREKKIYLGFAGTAYRFLLAYILAKRGKFSFYGEPELHKRPISELLESLNYIIDGCALKNNDCINIEIKGLKKISELSINAAKSSQYLTALLLTLPSLYDYFTIRCLGEIISKTYIDLTLQILNETGISIINENYKKFTSRNKQTYNFTEYNIEGDYSAASYFAGAAMLTGRKTIINNLYSESKQGDKILFDVFKKMGAHIEYNFYNNSVTILPPSSENLISPGYIDMSKMQDVVPTLAVVSAFAKGETTITNIGNLRFKECDRFTAVYSELKKLGIAVSIIGDSLKIIGCGTNQFSHIPTEISTYKDHRMAMAFSLAALKINGIIIKAAECVSKTFPDFYKQFLQLFDSDYNHEYFYSDIYRIQYQKFFNCITK